MLSFFRRQSPRRDNLLRNTDSSSRQPPKTGLAPLPLNVAIFNQDVFSINVTKIPKPLPECLDQSPRFFGIATSSHKFYPWDLCRLPRLCDSPTHCECDNDSDNPQQFSPRQIFISPFRCNDHATTEPSDVLLPVSPKDRSRTDRRNRRYHRRSDP